MAVRLAILGRSSAVVVVVETAGVLIAGFDLNRAAIAQVAVIAGSATLPLAIDPRGAATKRSRAGHGAAIGEGRLPRNSAAGEENLAVAPTRHRRAPVPALEGTTGGPAVLAEINLAIGHGIGVGLAIPARQSHGSVLAIDGACLTRVAGEMRVAPDITAVTILKATTAASRLSRGIVHRDRLRKGVRLAGTVHSHPRASNNVIAGGIRVGLARRVIHRKLVSARIGGRHGGRRRNLRIALITRRRRRQSAEGRLRGQDIRGIGHTRT